MHVSREEDDGARDPGGGDADDAGGDADDEGGAEDDEGGPEDDAGGTEADDQVGAVKADECGAAVDGFGMSDAFGREESASIPKRQCDGVHRGHTGAAKFSLRLKITATSRRREARVHC